MYSPSLSLQSFLLTAPTFLVAKFVWRFESDSAAQMKDGSLDIRELSPEGRHVLPVVSVQMR